MKEYQIMFYNRFVNETQLFYVQAESELKAVRLFYLRHNRKAYHPCIEYIREYRKPHFWSEEEIKNKIKV